MFLNSRLAIVLVGLIPLMGVAQEVPEENAANERPEPGTVQVPVQTESDAESEEDAKPEAPSRSGYLRVWNFTEGEGRLATGLRVIQGSRDSQESIEGTSGFLWLFRGMRPKDIRSYVSVPPGIYELVVIPETISRFTGDENEFRAPAANTSILATRTRVDIPVGGFSTVVLEGPVEKPTSQILTDNPSGSGTPSLRILNFSGVNSAGLHLIDGGEPKTILQPVSTFQVLSIGNLNGERTYQLSFPGQSNSIIRRHIDVNHKSGQSFTILVFRDRYDRLTFSAIPDGSR